MILFYRPRFLQINIFNGGPIPDRKKLMVSILQSSCSSFDKGLYPCACVMTVASKVNLSGVHVSFLCIISVHFASFAVQLMWKNCSQCRKSIFLLPISCIYKACFIGNVHRSDDMFYDWNNQYYHRCPDD